MFKIRFKDNLKKVSNNNKETSVTIKVDMKMSLLTETYFPQEISDWMWFHPSVSFEFVPSLKNNVIGIEVSGKSVCSENDTFNSVIGEKIAEVRAKIKLYRFMKTLTEKLYRYYFDMLYASSLVGHWYCKGDSLYSDYRKFIYLYNKEKLYLNKLLNEQNTSKIS